MHPVSRRLIDHAPRPARPAVRLSVRTADAAIADRLPGLAAELAFWVLLSLPSLVLTAIAALGAVSGLLEDDWRQEFIDRTAEAATVALTPQTINTVIVPVLEQLLEGAGFGLISAAFVATIWTASRAVKVVLVTLALVYGRDTDRPAWQARILGFAITLAAIVAGAVLAPLLLSGPNVIAWLDELVQVDLSGLDAAWRSLYWPSIIVAATLAIAILYHIGLPGRPMRWRSELPGAMLATGVWLAGSAALRLYGLWIAETGSVYGPLSGPIVLLLWIYVTGFAVLLGAELNAQRHQIRAERRERTAAAQTVAGPDEGIGEQVGAEVTDVQGEEERAAADASGDREPDPPSRTWPLSARPPR